MVSDETNGGLSVDTVNLDPIDPDNTMLTPKDRYGFFITADSPRHIEVSKAQTAQRKAKEAERALKWVRMIKKWSKYMSAAKFEKLKSRCRKGIPDAVRGYAWVHMTGAEAVKEKLAYDSIDTTGISQTVLDEVGLLSELMV
ncbi:hypothetical protein EON63_08000 [archaeon]|nr:MAG: hypothetical protein EON63_08000 [archaeon]